MKTMMKTKITPPNATAYAHAPFAGNVVAASVVATCTGDLGFGRRPHRPLDGSPPPL
jgi:hypothetical protein